MRRQMIAITVDKHGKPIAYRNDGYIDTYAWRRIGIEEAKIRIATGWAKQVEYVRNPR